MVVFDRNAANREKRVDTGIVTTMLEDSFLYMQPERGDAVVLMAGDGDYVPAVESLKARGIRVRVAFWEHGTSRDLRELADELEPLDPHLDRLSSSGPLDPGPGGTARACELPAAA